MHPVHTGHEPTSSLSALIGSIPTPKSLVEDTGAHRAVFTSLLDLAEPRARPFFCDAPCRVHGT
jgi:hypothetical protein